MEGLVILEEEIDATINIGGNQATWEIVELCLIGNFLFDKLIHRHIMRGLLLSIGVQENVSQLHL